VALSKAPCGHPANRRTEEETFMSNVDENLRVLSSFLKAQKDQGNWEQRELEDLDRCIRSLGHATKVGDRKELHRAVNNIARLLRKIQDK
jgi:hypothetical protein